MGIQDSFKSRSSTLSGRRPASRPCLEALEDRWVPSFTAGDYNLGSYSYAPLAADFNNDLVQDLALTTGSSVSVFLGNGDGTLGAAQSFPTGATGPGGPSSVAAMATGDFNGDGNLDLAAALFYDNTSGYPVMLLGNGDGTLQSPRSVWLEIPPPPPGSWLYSFSTTRVAVADANADGRQDLLFSGDVWYLTNNGEEFYPYGYTASSLGWSVLEGTGDFVAADFNADGKVDMVGTGGVRPGRGDGTFNAWQAYSAGPQGDRIAVDDFNGDGKLDIAATNSSTTGNGAFTRLGNGDGTVQPAQSYASATRSVYLATADFNGDGKDDLVTANEGAHDYPNPDIATSVTVRLGNGNGTFQAPLSFPACPGDVGLTGMAAADFNGDGRTDLAVSTGFNLRVLLNDGIWTSVSIGDVSVSEGNTGTRNATFTVTLAAAAGEPVTVAYATADGSASVGVDYLARSGTLTFAPGETSKTITVPVNGDRLPEPSETFFVNLSGPTNAFVADGLGVGAIINDEPRISISDVTKKEGNGKKTTLFEFTVTLSAAYDQAVSMSFATANGTATTGDGDYNARTGTLTFNPGETTKTITIEVKADSKKEADETFFLDLFGNSGNSLFTRSRGLGTILNDD